MSNHPDKCNLYLIGFSGTGKSSAAPGVAATLGFDLLDIDLEIARSAGRTIEDIFNKDGEEHFRKLERDLLLAAAGRNGTVVALGGGALNHPDNRNLVLSTGVVVLLESRPETIVARLKSDSGKPDSVRPLLAAPDPLKRITELKDARKAFYAIADWTVNTDSLTLEETILEIVRGWRYLARERHCTAPGAAAVVTTSQQSYPIFVGAGILQDTGKKLASMGITGKAFVISDQTVAGLYGQRMSLFIAEQGLNTHSMALPPGETSKNLDSVRRIYDFLVENKAERRDTIIAFGGGVVGDTAGFAAATYNRGMNLVQVPTTLVGMVDSSIGGKVGVDHPKGKNLIGAFKQPRAVIADIELLTTLPRRELAAGFAEVIKHGFVADQKYFDLVETSAASLASLDYPLMTRVVSGSVAIKADIVSRDERETAGLRTILNYGHTIAHGIEAATGYGKYLHGEAVAIGMVGAALLAQRLGLIDAVTVERHRTVLSRFGLPVQCADVSKEDVLQAIALDKKAESGAVRWVLLERIGKTTVQPVATSEVIPVLGALGMR